MPSTRITLSARHTGRFALRRNASLRRRFPCAPSLSHSFSSAFRSSFMINATQNPARNGDKILYSPPSNASSTGKFTSAKIKSAVNTIISKICFMFSLANFIRSLPSFIKKVYHSIVKTDRQPGNLRNLQKRMHKNIRPVCSKSYRRKIQGQKDSNPQQRFWRPHDRC